MPDSAGQKMKQQQGKTAGGGAKTETIANQRVDYESQNKNPKVIKAIESLANKWFSVSDFIQALRSIGLNIFPELDSDKFVTITAKVINDYYYFSIIC